MGTHPDHTAATDTYVAPGWRQEVPTSAERNYSVLGTAESPGRASPIGSSGPLSPSRGRQRRALLGRLVGDLFARQGEVAATRSLAILLEERVLKDALIAHLEKMTGTDLGGVESFLPEGSHALLGNPDLEGRDADGRPVLVIEAKFAANLTPAQVRSYLDIQDAELGDVPGVLALLVPSYRKLEAARILDEARWDRERSDHALATVALVVVTWDEWLNLWDKAVRELPEDERAGVVSDLIQLREMCATLVGLDIHPLGNVARGVGWSDRRADLHRLVERASASPELRGQLSRILPTGTERRFDFFRRYVGAWPEEWCALGVAGVLAEAGETPFWVRYHNKTRSFPQIRDRLMASHYGGRMRFEGDHVWLPLHVSDDVSGACVVAQLVDQVMQIAATATGSVSAPLQ